MELALTAAFASIGDTNFFAIFIDKHKTSLIDINEVVDNDVYCWRSKN